MPSLSNNELQVLVNSKANTAGIDQARKSVQNLENTGEKSSSRIGEFYKRNFATAGVAAAGLTTTIGLAAKAALGQADAYQQNRIAFETMLGSADKAKKLLRDVSIFAEKTPFALPDVVEGSKRLLAYNIEAEKLLPTFSMLGNIAAGVGRDKLPQLILAFGQVRAATYLTGAELRQFTEAGVPLLDQLAKQSGKSAAQIKEDMESGAKISFEEVEKALGQMTGRGGKFFNLMAKQSKTFGGRMSNIGDQTGRIIRQMVGIDAQGEIREGSLFDVASKGAQRLLTALERLTPTIQSFVRFIEDNRVVIAAFAGAIGGLLVLAVGAAITTFGGALVIMGQFMLVGAAIGALAFVIAKKWSSITGFFSNLWKKVTTLGSNMFNFFRNKINWLRNNWASAIGFMIGFFATLPIKMLIIIGRAVIGVINRIRGVNWGNVFSVVFNAWKNGWSMMFNIAKSVFNRVRGLNWGAMLKSIGKGIANTIIGLIEGGINGALSGIPGTPDVKLPRFAKGTKYAPGGMAIVGERGPELVQLPRGSKVFNNSDTERMTGSTINITNNNTFIRDSDPIAFARMQAFQLSRP